MYTYVATTPYQEQPLSNALSENQSMSSDLLEYQPFSDGASENQQSFTVEDQYRGRRSTIIY